MKWLDFLLIVGLSLLILCSEKSEEMNPPAKRIAVVGSGLAGLSAALAAAGRLPLARISIFEKNARAGGNSAKASSGINATPSPYQPTSDDSPAAFAGDTLASGKSLCDPVLVDILTNSSANALSWLHSFPALVLDKVTKCGGHSHSRTHRPSSGPNVGFAIVKALADRVAQTVNIQMETAIEVKELIWEYADDDSVAVSGLVVDRGEQGETREAFDAVILATGGFAASRDMIAKYAPQFSGFPTTNGPWADGSGLHLSSPNAELLHMDQGPRYDSPTFQTLPLYPVHPTGFINPAEPDAHVKFLAPEALRGSGGILLDPRTGQHFTDELETRDKVSAAISQLPSRTALLLLDETAVETYGSAAIQFYVSRGLMRRFESRDGVAEEYAWADQAGGRLGGPVWVGRVTPVLHYTMGGLKIAPDTRVCRRGQGYIRGLFAAGEVTAGVHGGNRLAGNSLLECVVFGRRAGEAATGQVDF